MLISILSALHDGVFTLAEVQGELEMLFEKQYILTETVTMQIRYRTKMMVIIGPYGVPQVITYQEPYEYYICTVKLKNKDLSHLPVEVPVSYTHLDVYKRQAFAILIVSNTWNIVMGVFDATQSVVNQSSGVIIGETSIHFDRLIPGLEFQLESMTIGSLLSLWFQTLVVGLTMNILSICIFLVTYGRMIEIYVVTALGPCLLYTSRCV